MKSRDKRVNVQSSAPDWMHKLLNDVKQAGFDKQDAFIKAIDYAVKKRDERLASRRKRKPVGL